MSNNNDISDADRKLFRNSVGVVKKIKHDQVTVMPRRGEKAYPDRPRADSGGTIMSMSSVYRTADHPAAIDSLFFKRPGIQNKLMRKLRRGHIPVERQLDLHGLSVREARTAMVDFLAQCLQQNIRCVRIVHGKGRGSPDRNPVIKNELYRWLRNHPDLLAVCSAPPHDGGTGAVYVLLKNSK